MAAIMVVGSLNMDLVIRAPRRPRAGETLLGGTFGMTGGGKGSNQALAVARLGAGSYMVGCVGQDDFGKRLRGVLVENGVNCEYLEERAEAGTGVAVITVTDDGEGSIIVSRGANGLLDETALERAKDSFASADAALFQMEVPPETVSAGLRIARRMGCRTFLSAEPPFELPSEAWNCIDCMVLNEKALNFYVSKSTDVPSKEEVGEMARQLQARGVRDVVVTQSARGGLVFAGEKSFPFDPFKVHVVDNTGARDAFCAGLCVGLAEGMTIDRAARFASAAGALACTRIGAHPSLPWRREVESLLEETAGDYAG
ncbi:MAG: ribokinase [Synergistaceae bacterium]|nr:ribokinase [Synergistaceae bacterium]